MTEQQQKIIFVKMTGAGNDFILIDELDTLSATDWSRLAPAMCDRRYGVGADGLLILKESGGRDFKMEYFNADGSWGGMCGNGGRCAAYYYMSKRSIKQTAFEALGDSYTAQIASPNVILRMKDPADLQLSLALDVSGEQLTMHFVNTGAPHAVIFSVDQPVHALQSITSVGILEIGRAIRRHKQFAPGGTNVDFVELISERTISMRSYERGVEGETLACGTGAVASSIIAALVKGLVPPIDVRTRSNEILRVDFELAGKTIRHVDLEGPARITYRGELEHLPSLRQGSNEI